MARPEAPAPSSLTSARHVPRQRQPATDPTPAPPYAAPAAATVTPRCPLAAGEVAVAALWGIIAALLLIVALTLAAAVTLS